MELIIEIIFEFVLDVCSEVCKDRKVSKWIRYPIGMLLCIFVIIVLGTIGTMGIVCLQDNSIEAKAGGCILIIFDVLLIISIIRKIKQELKKMKQ